MGAEGAEEGSAYPRVFNLVIERQQLPNSSKRQNKETYLGAVDTIALICECYSTELS